MSRFEQLRGWHKEQNAEIHEYWRSLQQTAEQFRLGFSSFLDAPTEGWRDSQGGVRSYVTFAKIVKGEHQDVTYHDLEGADSWLDFQFGVTVDFSSGSYPKKRIFAHVFMKKEHGGYHIRCEAPSFDIKVSNSSAVPDFDEVYEKLFESIRKNLSYRP